MPEVVLVAFIHAMSDSVPWTAVAAETTKSAQAALERKVARLKEELEAQSRELSEVRVGQAQVVDECRPVFKLVWQLKP